MSNPCAALEGIENLTFCGQFRVFGHIIDVYVGGQLDETSAYGLSDPIEKYIAVSYNHVKVASTFWHEVFHIVLGLSGTSHLLGDDLEESLVLALENGFGPLLEDLASPPSSRKKTRPQPRPGTSEEKLEATVNTITQLLRQLNR